MKPVWSLFPKSYQELDAPGLAALVGEVGLDTTNVVIRSGFPVDEATIKTTLPAFIAEAAKAGIKIENASTMFPPDVLTGPGSPMPAMADAGIREFRMGWFPKAESDVRAAIKSAKAEMDRVAEACQRHRIRAIYQIHHNTLITSATAAYDLVKGLPAQWVGVELDPGNQSFQGYEPWHYSVDLLGDYLAWVAVKDTVTWQEKGKLDEPDKGWRRVFTPITEGVTNWHRLVDALIASNFDGSIVFMPFYDDHDAELRTEKLKAEVDYLRAIWSREK